MGGVIDDLAKALASGVSRRKALAGLAAGAAVTLPWTSEAKKGHKKKKKKNRSTPQAPSVQPAAVSPFVKLQSLCDEWCARRFLIKDPGLTSCAKAAQSGTGPCYDAAEEGPGFFCLNKAGCTAEQTCCPGAAVDLGQKVKDATCCPPGTRCSPGISLATGICL
jgi:hypothetical protein